MKYLLLILISSLLLSSPVIGNSHKGETLYGWGECCDYVWKGFGDKETHPKYTGDVKNGKPDGLGILIYSLGGKDFGRWKDGKHNGQGTFTSPYGSKYVGKWKNGMKNGQGSYYYPSGTKYVGEYKDGKRWNGTQHDKDGNIMIKYVNGKQVEQ